MRRPGAFQAENSAYAKVLCQRKAEWQQHKSTREKNRTLLGGKQKPD